jgi:transcription elongation factor Elf1
MGLSTEKGKEFALEALQKRREKNSKKERVNNSSLSAGSPMYFYCPSCGEEIVVPENYIDRPKLCEECQALKILGWLVE